MKLLQQAKIALVNSIAKFAANNEKKILKGLKDKAKKDFQKGKISKQEYDEICKINKIKITYSN